MPHMSSNASLPTHERGAGCGCTPRGGAGLGWQQLVHKAAAQTPAVAATHRLSHERGAECRHHGRPALAGGLGLGATAQGVGWAGSAE